MKRFAVLACSAALLLSACGGGGSEMISPVVPVQPSSTAVQVNLGDGPGDALVAAVVTVNSMSMNAAGGSPQAVISTPQSLEMTHLMGTVTPLALGKLPQGSYSSATMVFGGATVTYIDAATGQTVQKSMTGPMTRTVQFNPPLVVGDSPMVLNLDMDMHASIQMDAVGNMTMAPVLAAKSNPMVPGSADTEDGGMHGFMAAVNGVNGNAFTMSAMQGATSLSCATDDRTQFAGMSGTAMMGNSMLVSVDAMPQADGSWMASNVRSLMGAGGSMAAGLVTGLVGTPITQLVVAMQEGMGSGMVAANLAGSTTVNVDSTTAFTIDADSVDLTGLPFTPTFDRSHVMKGQRVMAFSGTAMGQRQGMGSMMGGGTLTATSVDLVQQGLRGTVSEYLANATGATFTLALPADSAFATLSGASTVVVYQRTATLLRGITAIHNGDTVLARGLLFRDGATFKLISSRLLGV